jgi:hypothetical protein
MEQIDYSRQNTSYIYSSKPFLKRRNSAVRSNNLDDELVLLLNGVFLPDSFRIANVELTTDVQSNFLPGSNEVPLVLGTR